MSRRAVLLAALEVAAITVGAVLGLAAVAVVAWVIVAARRRRGRTQPIAAAAGLSGPGVGAEIPPVTVRPGSCGRIAAVMR